MTEIRGQKSEISNATALATMVFALCAMLFALSVSAQAQQPGKIYRIGVLENGTASGSAALLEAFRQELSKFGWVEGRNLTIEYRFGEGNRDHLPELAADLVVSRLI
jgi:putative ABC transport system substrate-binding protein